MAWSLVKYKENFTLLLGQLYMVTGSVVR